MLISKEEYEKNFIKEWVEDIDPVLKELLDFLFIYYDLEQIDINNIGVLLEPKFDSMNQISFTIHKHKDGKFYPSDGDIIEFIKNAVKDAKEKDISFILPKNIIKYFESED